MTGIVRGDGMRYDIDCSRFNDIASIGISGKSEKLVSYVSKNGKPRQITYANGNTMKAVYDKYGRLVSENGTRTAKRRFWLHITDIVMTI